jgi:hypothetical protein
LGGHLSRVTTSWSSVALSPPPTITLVYSATSSLIFFFFFVFPSRPEQEKIPQQLDTQPTTFFYAFPLFSFLLLFHHSQSHRIRSENNNNNFLLDELILGFGCNIQN